MTNCKKGVIYADIQIQWEEKFGSNQLYRNDRANVMDRIDILN